MTHTLQMLCLFGACSLMAGVPKLLTIGNPGNAGEKIPWGSFKTALPRGGVNYVYRMAEKEVTNAEYCEFLNHDGGKTGELWNAKMSIVRKNGKFVPAPGKADEPVNFVSFMAAASYCNYLSRAKVYTILPPGQPFRAEKKPEAFVSGFRDLSSSTQPVVYYLPDLNEFHKAAFYDGKGGWRKVKSEAERKAPSHYGLRNTADGVSEWVSDRGLENAYALGAFTASKDPKDWSGEKLHTSTPLDTNVYSTTGFRIAATAPVSAAPDLNNDHNYFGAGEKNARLRIRSEKDISGYTFNYELFDVRREKIGEKKFTVVLKRGINDFMVPLPANDGWYNFRLKLADGSVQDFPLAVLRIPYNENTNRHFGISEQVRRWEIGFSNEEFDYRRARQLGTRIIRCGGDLPRKLRFQKAGFDNLSGLSYLSTYDKWVTQDKKIIARWQKYGIAPELAGMCEKYYNEVKESKQAGITTHWCVGNEPHWAHVTPEDYAATVRATVKAIRLADPKAKIVIGDMGTIGYPVLSTGIGKMVDVINMHTYTNFSSDFWGDIDFMRRLNGTKNALGIGNKPVWITEANICNYAGLFLVSLPTLSDADHYTGIGLIKKLIGLRAYGAERIYIYNFRNIPINSTEEFFGMMDRNGYPKPGFASFRLTARLLGDAEFSGFLKGYSSKIGEIAAFGFKDGQKRPVAVFWRNDICSSGNYKVPYKSIFKAPQNHRIKGSGTAELFTADGRILKIQAKNGFFEFPVCEYPCFLRGDLKMEFQKEITAHNYAQIQVPSAFVQILPEPESIRSALDTMGYYELTMYPRSVKDVTVRVQNFSDREITGTLRLLSPEMWYSGHWPITPSLKKLTIPAQGLATVKFKVRSPGCFKVNNRLNLRAVFDYGNGAQASDKVAILSVQKMLKAAEWRSNSKNWTIKQEGTGLRLSWQGTPGNGIFVMPKNTIIVAKTAAEMPQELVVKYLPDHAKVGRILIFLRDSKNEVFILYKDVKHGGGPQRLVISGKAVFGKTVHYGGDKNGKADFPLRLDGITFSLAPSKDKALSGSLRFDEWNMSEELGGMAEGITE